MAAGRTIYFDISDLIAYAPANATLSGIQRMSVMVLNKLLNAGLDDKIMLLSFNRYSKEITTYSAELFDGKFSYEQDAFCAYFRIKPTSGRSQSSDLNAYIRRKYGRSLKGVLHFYRLKILNIISKGRKFRRLGIVERSDHLDTLRKGIPQKPRITSGDIIFMPGGTWNMDPLLVFLSDARKKGAKIIQFVHDLVPLVTPEHVVDGAPREFFNWMSEMTDISHGYLVNSEWTKTDLLKFIAIHNKAERPIRVVRLAHEFVSNALLTNDRASFGMFLENKQNYSKTICSAVYNAARLPYVLCVGTLESRKNIFTLARVWVHLEKELGLKTPRLVIAGYLGWLKADFDALLHGSGDCNGLIQVVERPFDHELEYLYRNCIFTVYPSYYEGWGLPVGESLWFGKPVVASNASSIPEVGGQLVDYVDPYDGEIMKATIKRLITDETYRTQRISDIVAAKLRNWDDVAREQMDAILEIADTPD